MVASDSLTPSAAAFQQVDPEGHASLEPEPTFMLAFIDFRSQAHGTLEKHGGSRFRTVGTNQCVQHLLGGLMLGGSERG